MARARTEAEEASREVRAPRGGRQTRAVMVILVVMVALAAVAIAKGQMSSGGAGGLAPGGAPGVSGPSMTSGHNDAGADYAAALKTGKPIYVLFHSLTCQPCVQISAVADQVVPAYGGRVVFVNAITDDPSAQRLASRFSFQYIPTSFFVAPGGRVVDSHTGVLSAEQMKARLDKLIAQ